MKRLLKWLKGLFSNKEVEVAGDFPDWYKDAVKKAYTTGEVVVAHAPEEDETRQD